jgi:DNA polymerase III subunit beta
MKVKLNRSALQEALGLVTHIVPSRTPKAILQCISIAAKDNTVRICGTDLEVGISCAVTQVEVEREGEIVVPADKIMGIVREGVDEVIELESSNSTTQVRGADSHFTIFGHEPSEYPVVMGMDGENTFEVGLAKLQEGIELSVFSAARESTRYALNGVLWEVAGKKLTLVATDGRRLAKAVVNLGVTVANVPDKPIIVPAKTMSLLDRIGGDESAKVAVRFVGNQVILGCGDVVITSNLVEGNFPKYEDIIPSDYKNKVTLSTDATLSAVRRAALLVTEESKGVKLSLSKGSLVFSSRSPESGDVQIDMSVSYSGAAIEIGFNPQFLIDVLRVIKAKEFVLELGDSDRPGAIKSGSEFLYIVMPVNI